MLTEVYKLPMGHPCETHNVYGLVVKILNFGVACF